MPLPLDERPDDFAIVGVGPQLHLITLCHILQGDTGIETGGIVLRHTVLVVEKPQEMHLRTVRALLDAVTGDAQQLFAVLVVILSYLDEKSQVEIP